MTASFFGLAALCIVTFVLLVRGLFSRAGILRYPFLAAAVVAGWYLPQAIGLFQSAQLPEGSFLLTMVVATLCLAATVLGERWAQTPISTPNVHYNRSRLLIGAAVLSAIGLVSYARILNTPAQVNEKGLTTGFVTILFFLAELQYFGFAIALNVFVRKFSWPALVIIAFDLNTMLGFILFGGRRGPAMDVFLIIACTLWFNKRLLPPRWAVILGASLVAVLFNSIGQYRSAVTTINQYAGAGEARLLTPEEFINLNATDDFSRTLKYGSYEARNSVMYISGAQKLGNYDLGMSYWNYLVFRYVPGQWVGADLKNSLMVQAPDTAAEAWGYIPILGTTVTGFTDSFQSFWLFGAFTFAGISWVMTRWWIRANLGDLGSQILYSVCISTAMEGVTHSTEWFVAYLPQVFIFAGAVLVWAKYLAKPNASLSVPRKP